MSNRTIPIRVSETEERFIMYAREVGYAEIKLTIMKGEPIKAIETLQQRRFDLTTDAQSSMPTSDSPKSGKV